MDIFIKSATGVLIAIIAFILLQRHSKDFSVILTLTVCVMIAVACIQLLRPVTELFNQLITIGKIDREYFQIIMKAVGIGLLSEITTLICNDAGNTAMGKMLHLLATVTILLISLPLFSGLIELFNTLLFTA